MNKWLWGLALGLLTLSLLPVLPPWPPVLAAACLILLPALRWRLLLPLAAFAFGLAWAVFFAGQALDARIPPAWEGQTLTVRGSIVDLPVAYADGGTGFRLRPDCVLVGDASCQPAPSLWQLSSHEALAVRPGERWEFAARIKRPHGIASPGAFDREGWLLEEGVGGVGYVQGGHRLQAGGWSVDEFRLQVRERFAQAFGNSPEAGVQLALLTGDRALVPQASWDVYSRTGITHLMAISGPHITLAGLVVMFFLRRLLGRFPRLGLYMPLPTVCLLTGFAVSVAYGFLAGLGIPTERTLLMLAVAVWAAWRRRELPAMAVLLRALVIVLLVQPTAVHAAGFWLSFMAVGLLMLLAGQVSGSEPAWRSFGRSQFIVTVGLLPLTIAIFARVSLVSPLTNALAIPLVTFVIVPLGMLGLLADTCWHTAGEFFWRLGIHVLQGLDWLLEQVAAWYWSALNVALTPLALLSLMLAAACLLLPRGLPGRYLALFFLLPAFCTQPLLPEGEWRLALLDVGQGLSVVVQTRHHVLVYDTGPAGSPGFDAGSRVLLPYLRYAGISRVDTLVLSHDDNDHTGGAAALIKALPVGQELGAWPQPLAAVSLPHQPCVAGQSWVWDGVRFRVLFPVPGLVLKGDNNQSCVLAIEGAGQGVLLPGDLERPGEEALLAQAPAALRASLLVLGHHGSASSSSAAFLAAVAPQEALVSAGYRNRFHHPSVKTLAQLDAVHIPYRSTITDGSLVYVMAPGTEHLPEPLAWRRAAHRYWLTTP